MLALAGESVEVVIYCLTALWFLLGLTRHVVKEQEKLSLLITMTGVQNRSMETSKKRNANPEERELACSTWVLL